jgi:hypothetical protein
MHQNAHQPAVIKWSSKQTDNAARIRNNQRRHRAKVRSYISCLESDLRDTQTKLREALVEIQRLNAELDKSQAFVPISSPKDAHYKEDCSMSASVSPSSSSGGATEQPIDNVEEIEVESTARRYPNDAKGDDTGEAHQRQPGETAEASPPDTRRHTVPGRVPAQQDLVPWDEDECCKMQPPRADESTTRCREAHVMIEEQNYAGVQASSIYHQLRPGFRGPVRDGDGCRVDNQLLFALLDQVSSST